MTREQLQLMSRNDCICHGCSSYLFTHRHGDSCHGDDAGDFSAEVLPTLEMSLFFDHNMLVIINNMSRDNIHFSFNEILKQESL